MFGLLGAISFKGKSSFYEEVCPRPWTCRGKDAKSRGTDILGRGKDIKRSARDYVLLEAIRYHGRHQPSPKRLLTENRLSQKNILRIAFGAPRHLKRPLPRECFFSSQGKTIGKKVGDVQAFVAAASSSLRNSQGIEPKPGVSPGIKPHQADPFIASKSSHSYADNLLWPFLPIWEWRFFLGVTVFWAQGKAKTTNKKLKSQVIRLLRWHWSFSAPNFSKFERPATG